MEEKQTQRLEIVVPANVDFSFIGDFSPEENEIMLKKGGEFVLAAQNYVVGEKVMLRVRAEVEGEYVATVSALKEEVKRAQIIGDFVSTNGDEFLRKEVAKLRAELEAQESKLRVQEEIYEARLEREIQRERKHAKALSDEWEKRVEVYRKNEEKMGVVVEFINARKNNTELGMEGEKEIAEMCCLAFRDVDGFEIKDVHTQKAKGDYHLVFKDMTILVDSKLYSGSVSAQEREKIKRDLVANTDVHFAWLVSLDTPVSKFDKGVFAFEWIAKDKCVCYVNSLRKSAKPVEVLRSLYFVNKMLYEQVIEYERKQEDGEKEIGEKMNALEKFREDVVANLEKYQKIVRDRERALRDLKDAFANQDELVRISLNSSTTEFVGGYYTKVYEWWNANVEEKAGHNLSSQQLWARYKRDTKEPDGGGGDGSALTIESFKEILVSFVKEFNKVGGKGGKLEILGVDFIPEAPKAPTSLGSASASPPPPPPEAKGTQKPNRKWTPEDLSELEAAFTKGKTLAELCVLLKRSEGGVLTQLKKHNLVSKYIEVAGFAEYKASPQFNKIYDE